jgi:hypothetical protein
MAAAVILKIDGGLLHRPIMKKFGTHTKKNLPSI